MTDDCFSDSYAEARGKFLAACQRRGARLTSYRNPAPGPAGEELCTDVAVIGASRDTALVIESGTHGVEAYVGSAIQIGFLDRLPADESLQIVLVHALNPYGFAWTRRVNEDNVDLNRNFVDHSARDYPPNPGYADLADAIVPREWTPAAVAVAEQEIEDYKKSRGESAVNTAFQLGQYSHPHGISYGGAAPTWSARTVARICADHLAGARRAALIDIHSGLGPSGHGQCITPCAPDSPEGQRATAWYGDVHHTRKKDSGYSASGGTIVTGYMDGAPHTEWTCIGLEFGTYPLAHMRQKLRAEGWLHAYGSPDHPEARRIKAELRDAYYPATDTWKRKVMARGLEIIAATRVGLAAGR